jgi:FIMAH domain-containing protein
MTGNSHLRRMPGLGVSLSVVLLSAMGLGGLICPIAAYAADDQSPVILETDYSNPLYLIGGVDQTHSSAWASDVCDGRRFLDNPTPLFEWTPVFAGELDERLVGFAGTIVEEPQYSQGDVWFTHPFGFDWEFFTAPDQSYGSLLAPSNGCTEITTDDVCLSPTPPENVCQNSMAPKVDDEVVCAVLGAHKDHFSLPTSPLGVQGVLGVETDQGLVPSAYRARAHKGDRVAVFGRWIADCGHTDFHSEVHPPLLMAFGRQVSGSSGQPVTYSEVISRPYLVSQTFEDGKGVRHHLYNELLKGMAIPDCPGISNIVEAALNESGGCTVDVCDPVFGICVPTYCLAPELWFNTPCTTRFEAHEKFLPKPFAGSQRMSYIVRPPVPRQCAGHKLLVSSHFTVRHGVTASIEPFTTDAARVVFTMDDGQYTPAPLPPKADMSLSIDDIRHFNDDTADTIESIRAVLLGLALFGIDPAVGLLFDHMLDEGLLTDCYDPSYATLPNGSTFPACGALTGLQAASPVDSQNVVVATPIDQLSGPISAEDNSDGQPFPVYGSASVEWSQEKFPPVITVIQPAATNYLHTDVLTLDYSVAETGCGVGSVTPLMDGMTTVHGHGLDDGQKIDLLTELTTGDHTFTVDAVDNVGGPSMSSVTFTIIVTAESIKDDVRHFMASGDVTLDDGRSLLKLLDAAANARARGNCATANQFYQALIKELTAQSGKKVSSTAAAIMIADAQYLIAHCP